MFKLLLLGVAFYLVYIIFFKKNPLSYTRKEDPKNKPSTDEMVACEKCQTYTAVDETIIKDGHYYCCSECAKEN